MMEAINDDGARILNQPEVFGSQQFHQIPRISPVDEFADTRKEKYYSQKYTDCNERY